VGVLDAHTGSGSVRERKQRRWRAVGQHLQATPTDHAHATSSAPRARGANGFAAARENRAQFVRSGCELSTPQFSVCGKCNSHADVRAYGERSGSSYQNADYRDLMGTQQTLGGSVGQ
jgi:hypothetical protein